MPARLLVLSNGHGEDLIALRILEALHRLRCGLEVSVMPLVGVGSAYEAAESEGWLRRIGPRQSLPSGGFSNQSLGGLLADLHAGLPLLSWHQWRRVRQAGQERIPILAVGDLLPLLLAWSSGGGFGFVGTPKSDYTWASSPPPGWARSPVSDRYHRCKGSEWDPWEWAVMGSHRCRLVAVRDQLTARGLRRRGVRACAPGNPMMDALAPSRPPTEMGQRRRLLLLPGSRMPEALRNLGQLLGALPEGHPGITVLIPTGSRPDGEEMAEVMVSHGFRSGAIPLHSHAGAAWRRGDLEVLWGTGLFSIWAPWAEVALAAAGTATEQVVGLGIPALSLPGPGPQFTAGFARRQSRLLGGAVEPCHSPQQLRQHLLELLDDPEQRQRRGQTGHRRMGGPGGSERLAQLISAQLLEGSPGG